MKEKKKFSFETLIIVLFCILACVLMMAPVFSEEEITYFPYDVAALGMAILVFLYGRFIRKSD